MTGTHAKSCVACVSKVPAEFPVDNASGVESVDPPTQVIRVSYKDWDRIAVSGRGLLHGELQVSWLQNELEHQGIVGPATIPSGNSPELWSPER